MMHGVDLSICLVTDSQQMANHGLDVVEAVADSVAGGVTAVQVRDKNADARDLLELLDALSQRLPVHTALFVNDRVDVFQAARSRGTRVTGVHIGQRDIPAEIVREMVGPDAVIGMTASSSAELAAAEQSPAGIGYVGIGAVRETRSKLNPPPAVGVSGVALLARGCALPALAIGGVRPDDLEALRSAGLAGVAVVSWICASADPRAAAAELAKRWRDAA